MVKNLGIDTKNTYVSDFDKKLKHFVCFRPGLCAFLAIIMLIYANLCKLDNLWNFQINQDKVHVMKPHE